jgi:hypothetical protein
MSIFLIFQSLYIEIHLVKIEFKFLILIFEKKYKNKFQNPELSNQLMKI